MGPRRVSIGDSSETPRKIFLYNDSDPSNCVLAATPTRKNYEHPLKSSLQRRGSSDAAYESENSEYEESGNPSNKFYRPKTSRGTSRPSLDAFFDYVIPSPVNRGGRNRPFERSHSAFVNTKSDIRIQNSVPPRTGFSGALLETESTTLSEGEYLDEREITNTTQCSAIIVGCWLFGSLLRVWLTPRKKSFDWDDRCW